MAIKLSADSFLFTHPSDMKQCELSFGVMYCMMCLLFGVGQEVYSGFIQIFQRAAAAVADDSDEDESE